MLWPQTSPSVCVIITALYMKLSPGSACVAIYIQRQRGGVVGQRDTLEDSSRLVVVDDDVAHRVDLLLGLRLVLLNVIIVHTLVLYDVYGTRL